MRAKCDWMSSNFAWILEPIAETDHERSGSGRSPCPRRKSWYAFRSKRAPRTMPAVATASGMAALYLMTSLAPSGLPQIVRPVCQVPSITSLIAFL